MANNAQGRGATEFSAKREVIPNWFYEQKRERKEKERKPGKQQETMADVERVKRELLQHQAE